MCGVETYTYTVQTDNREKEKIEAQFIENLVEINIRLKDTIRPGHFIIQLLFSLAVKYDELNQFLGCQFEFVIFHDKISP